MHPPESHSTFSHTHKVGNNGINANFVFPHFIFIYLFLQTVFSYIFRPLAYMFGVDWEECDTVAIVLGIKLLPNEMLAYLELGELRVKGQLSVSINEKKQQLQP